MIQKDGYLTLVLYHELAWFEAASSFYTVIFRGLNLQTELDKVIVVLCVESLY